MRKLRQKEIEALKLRKYAEKREREKITVKTGSGIKRKRERKDSCNDRKWNKEKERGGNMVQCKKRRKGC